MLYAAFPLNPTPSFKHPSHLKSVEHINELFNYSKLDIKYFGFLKYFSLGDNSVNLIDEREESEILIYARKI